MMETGMSEHRYRLLRKQLDELGYLNPLPIDALPLVEKITSDFLHTTDSLRHYKQLAQKSLQEKTHLENGIEPYRSENAKLVRQCNELHIKLLKSKEANEKQHQELKSQIRKLQSENSDLQFLSSQHLLLVKELEKESADKTLLILRLQSKNAPPMVIVPGGKKAPLRSRASLEIDAPLEKPKHWKDPLWSATAQVKDPQIFNMVELYDQRFSALSRENIDLRRKVVETQREVTKLQEIIEELSVEKRTLQKRCEGRIVAARSCMTSPVMEGHGTSVKSATEIQVEEHARLEKNVMESEDRVRRLEGERRELLTANGAHKAAVNNLEDQLEALRDQYQSTQAELMQQRVLYSQIKALHEQTDRAMAEGSGKLSQLQLELNNAQERIRCLECDRASLDREVATLRTEHTVLRGNLAQVDHDKDSLLVSVDNKTERIVQLEHQLKISEHKVLDLEATVIELRKKFDITLEEQAAREKHAKAAARQEEALRQELQEAEREREGALRENRQLQDDLATAVRDARQAERDLAQSLHEVDALKRQVQDYVAEIRRIEDMLQKKENERSEMLQQFRGLSLEATVLEENNHSLETEAAENKSQLREAQERIVDLEQQLQMKDSLLESYENQIADLTAHVARLETQMQEHIEERCKSEAEMEAMRDLCVKLDAQKSSMEQQVTDHDIVKMHLENEVARLHDEQEMMQEHLNKNRESISNLEGLLAASRQETAEQRQHNQELKCEVERLRSKVDELQRKLDSEQAQLQRYQTQADAFSRQIADLQRVVTNERFERTRAMDEGRNYSSTL